MKKILLGTTVLVGAAMFASAASAETPKVTLGGFSNFQAGWSDDDKPVTTKQQDYGFRNSNEIDIKVDGKTDAGLGYGAEIDLQADTSASADGRGLNASRTFTYLENKWGRVEMGDNKSAAAKMRVDASTLAVATGGINGDWIYFVTGAPTTGTGFITSSKLPTEHGSTYAFGDQTTYNATKVSYYTPSFSGFQAGVSYTPNVQSRGSIADGIYSNGRADNVGLTDAFDAGLTYNRQLSSNLKLSLAGTYEYASGNGAVSTANLGSDDVSAFNVGGLLGYQSFSIAGSYGYEDKTGLANVKGAEYYTLGGGYSAGPVGLSVTYL
ncbi:MAG: hypothetical protein B7X02_01685 [Rhodospirillales bacterium 12-54-5]|nr:MAG: hypothetical protein B7X02_01685 [Rhodospirillales bacterium 12-54-5]